MRRVLLIPLSLVLALVGWSTVCAQDFYVIAGVKRNYAPVPKTGQMTSYAAGDDGAWQKGVPSPVPRFTDNGDGTVTDKLTGLIWTKSANALGQLTWANALIAANSLASGSLSGLLTDGSKAGDWRLPNVRELLSLIDYSAGGPPVPAPTLPAGHPFTGVVADKWWTSTTVVGTSTNAWTVSFLDGMAYDYGFGVGDPSNLKTEFHWVWCVRGGP
jgi:hypothetical protein